MNQLVTETETTKFLADPPRRPEQKAATVIVFFLIAAAALFIGIGTFGIYTRNQWTGAVQQRTNEAARMLVEVVHPEKSTGMIHLQLPGQTMPYTDAPIFAQTSGYLKKWYFDIGTKVKTGEVLAEIDTPEVDQILAQAKAILAQAKAQLKMAQAARDTYKRYQNLFKGKVISAQDFDTAADNCAGNQAVVTAEQANVDRLEAQEAFKIIRAPFDGIVTARNMDIGAYIPLGSGIQVFRMARISPLRVYVDVPEAFTEFVKVGAKAELTAGPVAGRKFPAQVVGTAGAINPTSKRLLTELEVPNKTGELFPGAYVQVTLKIDRANGDLMIPAGTLLFTSGKASVGVVRPNGTVEIRTIAVSRDLGSKQEISRGLSESDQIVGSPAPGLVDGDVVNVLK